MFRIFISEVIPLMAPEVGNLFSRSNLQFPLLMFYNIWIGFGGGVLMYSNKMATISNEIVESANLDGATGFKEFWYIVLPLSYSTISLFIVTGVASIFIGQYAVYDMFAWNYTEEILNVGVWFFLNMIGKFKDVSQSAELPYYAAIGLCFTFVTLPLMLITKWATEKFGPSED